MLIFHFCIAQAQNGRSLSFISIPFIESELKRATDNVAMAARYAV